MKPRTDSLRAIPKPVRSGPNIPESQRGTDLVGIRLDREQEFKRRLKALAQADGVDVSSMVERLVEAEEKRRARREKK